jgi:PAS domain S-box-containing protein
LFPGGWAIFAFPMTFKPLPVPGPASAPKRIFFHPNNSIAMSEVKTKKTIDLFETKRLKKEIEEKPLEFKSIIEKTDLCICVTDAKGYFVAVNNNYCRVYGYSRYELVGKHFSIVVPGANVEELKKLHDKFIQDKYEILRNWEVVNKTGEKIKIQVDAGYTEKIDGKPHKITFVMPE